MIYNFPRIKLGHFSTPIEYLANITEYLDDPEIFIKRDGCNGLTHLNRHAKTLMGKLFKSFCTISDS